MNLYSENLVIRPFELGDAERVRELAGDYEIAKTTLNIPHPYPESAAEEFIKATHETAKEGRGYDFAIIRKLDSELVGAIALGITSKYKRAEMGYWMGYFQSGFGGFVWKYSFYSPQRHFTISSGVKLFKLDDQNSSFPMY